MTTGAGRFLFLINITIDNTENADTDGLVIFINHPCPCSHIERRYDMKDKETILERFMRDQRHKASSLYNSGYRAGFDIGFQNGRAIAEVEDFIEKTGGIKVGDEVIDPNGIKAIVTNTDTHFHLYYPANGKTWKAPKTTVLEKTGARFDMGFPE